MSALYHGSADFLHNGTLLQSQPQSGTIDDELKMHELITLATFDHFKPQGAIGRFEAIYCADTPEQCSSLGAWGDLVYEVEPVGPVERHHAGWFPPMLNLIGNAFFEVWERHGLNLTLEQVVALLPRYGWPDPEMEAIAADYWEGLAADNNDRWEYLMRQAVVVREIEMPDEEVEEDLPLA
jgi:hypothetical protein